jgi:hypothetical protein
MSVEQKATKPLLNSGLLLRSYLMNVVLFWVFQLRIQVFDLDSGFDFKPCSLLSFLVDRIVPAPWLLPPFPFQALPEQIL